jgi:hypothetical protein
VEKKSMQLPSNGLTLALTSPVIGHTDPAHARWIGYRHPRGPTVVLSFMNDPAKTPEGGAPAHPRD